MSTLQRNIEPIGNAWLARQVLASLTREAERATPKETGGILLGYWADDVPVITRAVGPGPEALHGRYGFMPDHKYQEKEIARLYEASDRTIEYLGDWHTHPGAAADLSPKDEATLKTIAAHRPARVARPLMLILSPGPEWVPTVWQGELKGRLLRRRKLTVRRLALQIFDERALH